MGVGRRAFFSTMAMAGAGLVLPRSFVYEPRSIGLPSPANLESLTLAVALEMERRLPRARLVGAAKIGQHGLNARRAISMLLIPETEMMTQRFVEPVADALACDALRLGHESFGYIPKTYPSAKFAHVKTERMALRGIMDCDPVDDMLLIRFDQLVGA